MEVYKCKHFIIEELVDPALYEMFKDNEIVLWRMFDPDLLKGIDWMRDKFGPATINNWKWNGDRKWSGLRSTNSPWYSSGSMHSVGGAADMLFNNFTAEEVREELRNHRSIPFIQRVEDDVSWVHVDTKPRSDGKLYFFKP